MMVYDGLFIFAVFYNYVWYIQIIQLIIMNKLELDGLMGS